jgi:glycosyltransferase involved in cell wall biosynthesis
VKYKGFDILIHAMRTVRDASLLIVGDGPEASRLDALVGALGLRSRVTILHGVDDCRLFEFYASADALCVPSLDRSEAFGLVVLEARFFKKPVIASDIPGSGIGGLVSQDSRSHLIKAGDIGEWSRVLNKFVERPPPSSDDSGFRDTEFTASWRAIFEVYRGVLELQ